MKFLVLTNTERDPDAATEQCTIKDGRQPTVATVYQRTISAIADRSRAVDVSQPESLQRVCGEDLQSWVPTFAGLGEAERDGDPNGGACRA